MDPPSYGRARRGSRWKKPFTPPSRALPAVLSDRALFFMLNSYTAGLCPL